MPHASAQDSDSDAASDAAILHIMCSGVWQALQKYAHASAQDSDRFWRVTPPARRSIQRMLNSSAATLALSWEVLRNAPLATKNGGPLCQGVQEIPLSAASSQDILVVLQVTCLSSVG